MPHKQSSPLFNMFNYIWDHYLEIIFSSIIAVIVFVASYFYNITLDNYPQFIALTSVIWLDGLFGIAAGIKREGFQTFKAIKILRTTVIWWLLLATILSVEAAFTGAGWLSETIMIPFLSFQILSTLKNASMSGFIKVEILNQILDKVDRHKGNRK